LIALFLAITTFFVYKCRARLTIIKPPVVFPFFYAALYKSRRGINEMDRVARKFPRLLRYAGYLGILVGFLGMAVVTFSVIQSFLNLFLRPEQAAGVAPVMPIKAKGVFFVPFFYWIISIFIIALVHEFSHGIIARTHNLKIKSSGFAFLGILIPIIPAAFVEPDEKELKKRPYRQQLSIFAAGPFSNIALAFLIILLSSLLIAPVANAIIEFNGVKVTGFVKHDKSYPAELAGIKPGEIVTEINGIKVGSLENFSSILQSRPPGSVVDIKTNSSAYSMTLAENPENKNSSYLGVYVEQSMQVKESIKEDYGRFLPLALVWVAGLLRILVILNLGIGLFNLVPIGPLDGGRMLQLVLHRLFDKEKGDRIWKYIGVFFLTLVFVNIAFSFIR